MNLLEEARKLNAYWTPRVVGRINDQYVKVAKLKDEFTWHNHENEDEMFLVLEGSLTIEYHDRENVQLSAGDIHIVPRGVMHNPVCDQECLIALIEPVSTLHTGDKVTNRTVSIENQLRQE